VGRGVGQCGLQRRLDSRHLGHEFRFRGSHVIEAFEGSAVPIDSQSAEANLLDRNIDVVLADVGELVSYLGEILTSTNLPDKRHQLTAETVPMIATSASPISVASSISGPVGIRGPRFDDSKGAVQRLPAPARLARALDASDALVEQYQDLLTDANRVDLEFILQYGFSDAVAIYNYVQEVGYKRYPAIVGGLRQDRRQPFVIVGTQPSYQLIGETVIKRPSNPAPEDFAFMERMLEMGERLHLPHCS